MGNILTQKNSKELFYETEFDEYYLNEATLIIIIGLGLDIVGAVFIIGPLRHRKYLLKRANEIFTEIFEELAKLKEEKIEEPGPQSNKERIDRLTLDLYDRELKEFVGFKKINLGITLLILGFVLQIIGNLIQNPPL